MLRNLLRTLLGVLPVLLVATTASASAITITPLPANTFNNGIGYSLGYLFFLGESVSVTELGYFSDPTLTESHQVGIYAVTDIFSTSGTLVASATVTNADPLSDLFRYASISPVTLVSGYYVIAGTSGLVDPYAFNPAAFSTDSRVTWIESREATGNFLQFPATIDPITGNFGPNFNTAPVPEPGSLLLLGAGLALARSVIRKHQV